MTDEEFDALQRKAEAALTLMGSDTWALAYGEATSAVLKEWSSAAWSVPEIREQKFAEMKGLQLVEQRLHKWVADAKFEAEARERRARLRQAD